MQDLLKTALKASHEGQSYAFATVIDSTKGTPQKAGAKMIVLEDGTLLGTIGGGKYEKIAQEICLKSIKTKKPKIITFDLAPKKSTFLCGGQVKIFIEPFCGQKHLIICGAGHIALPLSIFGKLLNYKVTIIDNRKEFANKKRFPHADTVLVGPHAKKLAKMRIDQNSLIVITTQGHKYDFDCLSTVIKSKAKYIGVISSKTKRREFLKKLETAKVAQKFLNRISIPVGLDIGAQTPEEIAVSIMAEIVAAINKDLIGSSKFQLKEDIK